MKNAEWMIKNGYKFSDLDIEDRGNEFKIYLKGDAIGQYPQGFTLYEAAMKWLDMEHKEPILDDAERKYLSAVVKPFRDNVKLIRKADVYDKSYIYIMFANDDDVTMFFPYFEKGAMYKGMKPGHGYTLEELGL